MDWIVVVPKGSRARGCLPREVADAARRVLRVHGVVVLRAALSERLVDGLYKEYAAQFGVLDADGMKAGAAAPAPTRFLQVGSRRYDITPKMTGAFADASVFADPLLLNFMAPVLGEDMRLGGFTIVASFPGAAAQRTHRDHPQLFSEGHLGTVLPAYAINVSVPLVDVNIEVGPTAVWLGSHLWPEARKGEPESMTTIPFRRGDCMLLDYRTIHGGLSNQSRTIRPILYMAYTRSWFVDDLNHKDRASLDMSLETYLSLPEPSRRLLLRAYSQAMRSRQTAGAPSAQAAE